MFERNKRAKTLWEGINIRMLVDNCSIKKSETVTKVVKDLEIELIFNVPRKKRTNMKFLYQLLDGTNLYLKTCDVKFRNSTEKTQDRAPLSVHCVLGTFLQPPLSFQQTINTFF